MIFVYFQIVASSQGLNENGIDLGVSCALHFSGNRVATFITDLRVVLSNEAIVYGSEGRVKVKRKIITIVAYIFYSFIIVKPTDSMGILEGIINYFVTKSLSI